MNRLADADPLAQALRRLVGAEAGFRPPAGEVRVEPLPSSRQVLRFTFPAGDYAVVGKFFSAYPPQASADLSLAREYDHYLRLPALGLGNGGGLVPRLLGRWPERSLGLLLEAVPGPDLDHLLLQACVHGDPAPSSGPWKNWRTCWPFFTPGRSRLSRWRPSPPWLTWTR